MHITLGSEVSISLHTDEAVSYTELEKALVDAGFENYTIMRNANPDGSADAQLYVRGNYDGQGQPDELTAGETMTKLSEAVNALEEDTEQPPPE
jgi:hypothetical protein